MSRRGPQRRSLAVSLLVLTAMAQPALPQQSDAPPAGTTVSGPATLSVKARLVNLPVIVRDGHGNLLQNLTKDDFALQVDGEPQRIRYFDQDVDLPLTLGLLVDTSGSVRPVLEEERTASVAFLDQMLTGEDDRAFIMQFASSSELLQDVTNSHQALEAALGQVGSPTPPPTADPNNRHARAAGTTLYDAAYLASKQIMVNETRRRALILLTDGEDNGSRKSLDAAIEAAQRADTIVYAIYFNGDQSLGGVMGGGRGGNGICIGPFCINAPMGYPGGGGSLSRGDGKPILERICAETGGRVFEISRKQKVADIYRQIGEELRAQYRLAFTPANETAAGGYHKIDLVLTTGADATVQTRQGYYAKN